MVTKKAIAKWGPLCIINIWTGKNWSGKDIAITVDMKMSDQSKDAVRIVKSRLGRIRKEIENSVIFSYKYIRL